LKRNTMKTLMIPTIPQRRPLLSEKPAGPGRILRWILFFTGFLYVVVLLGACQPEMGDDVVALVNGQSITNSELAARQRVWAVTPMSKSDTPGLRRMALNQLIEEELILQAADEAGIEVSDKDLEARIDEIKKDFPKDSFKEMLIREYIDYETWREDLHRRMIIEKATRIEAAKRVKPDPEKWQAFFNANRGIADPLRRVKVIHLTLADQDRVAAALKKIRAGKDFEATAKKEIGKPVGDPIWVYPNMLPPEMAQVLVSAEPGQVTEVVRNEFGYTIFKILDVEKKERQDPVLIMARLRREFRRIQEDEAFREWVTELKQRAKIIINPKTAGLEPDREGQSE
jgi:parvulin-like peptidyl-prolyl isomerase